MPDETRCGACGHAQRVDEDRGALTFGQLARFIADALIFKRPKR